MYSIHNEQKSAIAERFIRSLKYKIYKYISSKQLYIDTLDDTVKKFNNTYDAKSNTYINSGKDINNKNPKFENGDIVRISKYKNIFANGFSQHLVWVGKVINRKDNTLYGK